MHLLFTSNNEYIPHVATTLASIFENNVEFDFFVHILVTDISDNNRSKLEYFIKRYGHQLDIKLINSNLDIDLSVCGKWGIFPSLKLYAADLFPDIDRILYLDADMICLGSLKYIDSVDISDYYLAMVSDEEGAEKHKQRLNLNKEAFYGCAGLVLFNLKKWRQDNIREKCFKYFNDPQNKNIIKWGEQDVLNKVLQGYIMELPLIYNMLSFYWLHHGKNVPVKYRPFINDYKKNAVIIHYIDSCKPWFKDNLDPNKKYYWKYSTLTPWKDSCYGYSPNYKGYLRLSIDKIKVLLHRLNIKKYDYLFDKK